MLWPDLLFRFLTAFCLGLLTASISTSAHTEVADPPPAKPVPNPSGPATTSSSSPSAEDAVAYVNGAPIPRTAVEAALAAAVRHVPVTSRDCDALRTAILNDLIDDKLLEQFLDRHNIPADPKVIATQKDVLLQRLRREQRTLADYCREMGTTEEYLQKLWSLHSRWQRYVQQEATDDRIRAFYHTYKERFERTTAHASHILLRLDPHASAGERQRLKKRLESLREQIMSQRLDFASAARRYSHCPSASSGGDLGTLSRHTLPHDEPWLQHAFTLPVGRLSPVIESELGFHLFYIHERTHRPAPPLEECLPEVLEAFAEDLREQTLQQLRRNAQITYPKPKSP
jgi:parvulin-like peptidyl-prolyl isomerase